MLKIKVSQIYDTGKRVVLMGNIEGLGEFMNYIDRVASNVDNIINESLEETATMVIADTKLSTPVPS